MKDMVVVESAGWRTFKPANHQPPKRKEDTMTKEDAVDLILTGSGGIHAHVLEARDEAYRRINPQWDTGEEKKTPQKAPQKAAKRTPEPFTDCVEAILAAAGVVVEEVNEKCLEQIFEACR